MRGTPGVNEKDWKLFRSKMPGWQEAYMDRLNQEYIRLLSAPGNPADKFWELEKRIRDDQKSVGVVARMNRSNMYTNIGPVQKLFIHYACLNPPLLRCRRSTCPGTPPSSALH